MTGLGALLLAATAATGFDHFIHEGRVTGSGAAQPTCADCHDVRPSGAIAGEPGHAQCFTGACHGDPPARPRRRKPYPIADDQRRLCLSCHAPDDIDRLVAGEQRKLDAFYRPYSIDPDYALRLSHAGHASANCTTCHPPPGAEPGRRRPHDRCAPCHAAPGDSGAPAMTACERCHRSAFGPAVGPTMQRGSAPVTAGFDHRGHARAAKNASAACTTCHAAIAETEGDVLPAPAMAVCATCHDGDRAFSTTAARCRECHRSAGAARPEQRDRPGFSHGAHAERGMQHACRDCHRLDADGRPRAPAADHDPCSNDACHAAEFASPAPTVCGTCHVGSEPWRPLRWFPPPRAPTEFGAAFSHAGHAEHDRACSACHDTGTGARRPVDVGHAACSGAGCHELDAGAPPLADCTGCHERGLIAGREAEAARSRWSVRARFRHDAHGDACRDCHPAVERAASLADIAPPAKQRCTSCHDGRRAFKTTGHACARCHAKRSVRTRS